MEVVPLSIESKSNQPVFRTRLSGQELLQEPRYNKGTAFTEAEREAFGLRGLPSRINSLEEQCQRCKTAFDRLPTPFAKYCMMRELQDSNETLFYALMARHTEEMLPIVYTPAVGEGCQRFSEIWQRTRGLFLGYQDKKRLDEIFADPCYDEIRCIVVSDGERILGLGDLGAGGMGIPIGKMALYSALGGIPPWHCLPILLDTGTDNETLYNDPAYIGWRHHRIRGGEYDEFIEAFVQAVMKRWPKILLQWEDFAGLNAFALLDRYRDRLCTFNDDIQGTAAITTGTLLAAVHATGLPLSQQTILMFGSGSAGLGISDLLVAAMQEEGLTEAEARQRIYAFNRYGLLIEGCQGIKPGQDRLLRKRADVAGWKLSGESAISLFDVVRNANATVLVGTSAQPGAFTEEIVREMASHTARPVIFPLSNPTSKAEAVPADLLHWTEGRALVGTGSPFPPVEIGGKFQQVSQVNNSYIFPGLALGILVSEARRVTDSMIMASARALAGVSPARKDKSAPLLPPIAEARNVSLVVGEAVARQAIADGVSDLAEADVHDAVEAYAWTPEYPRYERTD